MDKENVVINELCLQQIDANFTIYKGIKINCIFDKTNRMVNFYYLWSLKVLKLK